MSLAPGSLTRARMTARTVAGSRSSSGMWRVPLLPMMMMSPLSVPTTRRRASCSSPDLSCLPVHALTVLGEIALGSDLGQYLASVVLAEARVADAQVGVIEDRAGFGVVVVERADARLVAGAGRDTGHGRGLSKREDVGSSAASLTYLCN